MWHKIVRVVRRQPLRLDLLRAIYRGVDLASALEMFGADVHYFGFILIDAKA
jgi:hypothetical protein